MTESSGVGNLRLGIHDRSTSSRADHRPMIHTLYAWCAY